MPQTYMPAVPVAGPITTSSWLAVSKACSRGAADDCGSEGGGRKLQACMPSPYPGASRPAGSRAAALRRSEPTCCSSASDDEVGGLKARSAARGSEQFDIREKGGEG